MKRILLLMILSCFTAVGFAQDVYYWVGGATATSLTGTNWKKDNIGNNVSRSATTDILVFDGVTVAFNSGGATIGKLQLQNGADVSFSRTNTTNTGTSTLSLTGADALVLSVSGNSKLRLIDGIGGSFVIALGANKQALINNSEVYIQGSAWPATNPVTTVGAQRIQVPTAGSFVFSGTSKCFTNVANTYPFSLSTNSGTNSVVFQTGTSLVFQGGRNPFGEHATNFVIEMKDGSTFVVENNIAAAVLKDRWMKNVTIRNNVDLSMGTDNFNNINDLTIENGSTFQIRGTGPSPISGNIVNNGTLTVNATGSSNLLMIGHSPQSISGTGAFNLGAFSVAEDANVTLNASINIAGSLISYIYGTLNVQGNQLKTNGIAAGTGRIQFRPLVSNSTNGAIVAAGSNVINFGPGTDFSNLAAAPGVLISGPNLEPNTYVINTSSGGNGSITLSKPAISSGTSVTVLGTPATLVTSNLNGVDGSFDINSEGTLTLSSGTNVVFNATTLNPFPITTGSQLGDVTFNAAATTNKSVTINGKLTLNNSKLIIRETEVVNMGSTGSFDGNSSAYIVTSANAPTGAIGKLRLTDWTTSMLIPVGTATHYAPVTLAPTATSTFEVNVFEGVTANAAPNGTALTAAQKLKMVDAVWNINRTSGAGNVDVTLGWDGTLEGTDFAGFTNSQIGVTAYNSGAYGTFIGPGSATNNNISFTTSTLSPFVVGEANTTLPLKLLSFTGKESLNSVKLAWQTTSEVNLKNYILQHRTATGFEDIYTVAANNQAGIFNYSYTHLKPVSGVNYYRLVGVDLDGTTHASEPIQVNFTSANKVAVYPNPVASNLLSVSGVVSGDVIRILNIQGQVIATQKASGNQVQEINLPNVQSGTYILSIENAGKITSTKKVIKI